MSDKTSDEQELSRDDVADNLQALARELRGDGPADIPVGNKNVVLTPAAAIDYDITVEERSPMLGGERETITVTLDWEAEESD